MACDPIWCKPCGEDGIPEALAQVPGMVEVRTDGFQARLFYCPAHGNPQWRIPTRNGRRLRGGPPATPKGVPLEDLPLPAGAVEADDPPPAAPPAHGEPAAGDQGEDV